MTKQLKLKTVFALLFSGIILCSCGMFVAKHAPALAVTETQITAENFYMEDGASVRLVENSSGIRFKANITKGAYDEIVTTYPSANGYTYRVYTKIAPANNSAATPKTIEHSKGFEFEDGAANDAIATVNAAIIYDNLDENLKEAAYKTLLSAQTFIDVKKDNSVVKTYQAAVPSGNSRSMRAVANAEKISGNEDELLNNYIGDCVVEESGAKINTFVDKGTVTLPSGITPEAVSIGAEEVSFSVDSANSLINFNCDKDYSESKYVAIFDASGNVYNYKADIENCAYINEGNYKDETYGLFAAIAANVDIVLESDLDMTGMARTTTGTYDKTFDGNGKTLSNLSSITSNNGGLFYTFGGTIKDVVIDCVQLGSTNIATGIIAYQNDYLDVNIENVYIEVGSVTIGNVGQAGLFVRTQQNTNHGKITATNMVINFAGTVSSGTANYFGYLCGYGTAFASGDGQFALDNCYFYNGDEYDIKLFVEREGWITKIIPDSTYTVYNNGNTSMNAYKVKKYGEFNSMMNTALTSSMAEGFTVTEINSGNYKDETNGLYASIQANKNILLTSDLDMTGISTIARDTMGTYTVGSIFDGNEHTISNLTVETSLSGGLFGDFRGTLCNVSLTNVSLGSTSKSVNNVNSAFGAIAYEIGDAVIVSNVFVDIVFVQARWAGGISAYGKWGGTYNDVVIIMPALTDTENMKYSTDGGEPGALHGFVFAAGWDSTVINGYFVGCGGNITGSRTGSTNYKDTVNQKIAAGSTYKTYTAVSDLTADTTKTLTPFLTKCLAAKNG